MLGRDLKRMVTQASKQTPVKKQELKRALSATYDATLVVQSLQIDGARSACPVLRRNRFATC